MKEIDIMCGKQRPKKMFLIIFIDESHQKHLHSFLLDNKTILKSIQF